MARSIDPASKAVRGFVPARSDEERYLMRHIEDLARTAESRGIPRYSAFLSDREQDLARAALNRAAVPENVYHFEGGWPGAERRLLCLEPEGSWPDSPLCCVRLTCRVQAGAALPAHKDYLGSLMGLELRREALGDIVLPSDAPGTAYVFALEPAEQLICQELLQAGARFHSSHSDTEVILQAYRVWGTDCLQRFDGMFAFALWDAPRRRLFCARDRFGKKPFFYTLQQGSLFFGSELNCLAAVPGLELSLDPQAVMRYLAYEYVPTPDTMYREAKSLPPSHWLLVEDGRLTIRRYWDLPPADEDDRRSEADICADVHELLTRAVGRRMVSDVPLGVFLSGGIDSSIVAGLMARQSSTPIKTFSIGFTEASYDESRYARVVAQRWNTDHHERVLSAEDCAEHLPSIISRMDVPMADASVAPTWLLSGVTREKVTVALGGDGADELWAGYEHYIAFKIAEWYNAIPGIVRRGVMLNLRDASCWSVDVMNGGAGFFFFSVFLMLSTRN